MPHPAVTNPHRLALDSSRFFAIYRRLRGEGGQFAFELRTLLGGILAALEYASETRSSAPVTDQSFQSASHIKERCFPWTSHNKLSDLPPKLLILNVLIIANKKHKFILAIILKSMLIVQCGRLFPEKPAVQPTSRQWDKLFDN